MNGMASTVGSSLLGGIALPYPQIDVPMRGSTATGLPPA
jgi:hypothetical protein